MESQPKTAYDNPSFIHDTSNVTFHKNKNSISAISNGVNLNESKSQEIFEKEEEKPRETWGNSIEFLFSCIAMSVGLGNIWRFPFTALENGGGAFVIPYLIVLFLVGKPSYFVEMILGQFSSKGSVKLYDFCPIMRGIGFAQTLCLAIATTYYAALISIIAKYFYESFSQVLPWSVCEDHWKNVICVPSGSTNFTMPNHNTSESLNVTKSSAELYFMNDVLKIKDGIHDGIGTPNPDLMIFLIISWSIVFLIMIKGVRSSGKASYVLAIFPYLILGVLLIRSLSLPGAMNGVIYFLKPNFYEMLNPRVWYAAVTQMFFSLSVCFSNIITYSSYNKFSHNIHRDATIVTTLDTFTSLIAGLSIFGTLGNLAYETGTEDISKVVKEGTGLAFISYPDALAKFTFYPQLFSALFFFMLMTLGIGTNVAQMACFVTVLRDRFPKIKHWHAALLIAIVFICLGSVYLTPGGQYIMKLVDFYGCSFVVLILAIFELVTIGWIYGVPRLCKDIQFMLGFNPNAYWRICWRYLTPGIMTFIFLYDLANFKQITYNGYVYPDFVYDIGYFISFLGIIGLPIFAVIAVLKQDEDTLLKKLKKSLEPQENWGPANTNKNIEYKLFMGSQETEVTKF